MPKQITQAELQTVLKPYKAARAAALSIRRRIELEGAEIEAGPIRAKTEGECNPLRDMTDKESGALIAGLEVLEPAPKEETSDELRVRIASTLVLADLDDFERAFLASCQKIFRRGRGCECPFEEFFRSLVTSVKFGDIPTPDDVAEELETFRGNFDSMRRSARQFTEAYPEKETVNA